MTLVADLARLTAIMARLRDPERGCDWDVAQSFATIAPYTIEEAYEVADAIARDDMAALKDELGDLLFQVVFHSQMAEEAGAFSVDDVITAICDKMERRHPHIFGEATERPDWEAMKAAERAAKLSPLQGRGSGEGQTGALDGVALSLPALSRAEKLQRRAARVGFDWPDAEGPKAKVHEEIAEIEAATTEAERSEEFGDLLFSVVNWARHMGVEPEAALRAANAKFEGRFAAMEALHAADGATAFSALTLDEMEALWARVKAS
jgi:ATP diphosphatase